MTVQNKDLDENTKMPPSLSKGYMQPKTVLGHGIKGFNADERKKSYWISSLSSKIHLPCIYYQSSKIILLFFRKFIYLQIHKIYELSNDGTIINNMHICILTLVIWS